MRVRCNCGALNELPNLPKARVRCRKCKYEFTPRDLAKAIPSSKPTRPAVPEFDDEGEVFDLEAEED